MDMLMTLAVPVGCFVAFVLSLICLSEIVLLPWLHHRRLRRDAQVFLKPESLHMPRRYPASGGSV
jgi:hypothetical protein